jgi:hypothetical protein
VTVVSHETRARWLVVAAVVAVLVTTPIALAHRPAGGVGRAAPDALYAKMLASTTQPFQGFVVSNGAANLPILPSLDSVISLLDGETSLRVWYAAADRWRVDTLATDGERDLYRSPTGETVWDSGLSQLITISGDAPPARLPRGADLVPPTLARRLLSDAAAGAGATRTALAARRVAGIDAAGIRVIPHDTSTTVGRVDIWADPASGLPLQVEVTTVGGSQPVLETRFLDLDLTSPPAAVTAVPSTPRSGTGATTLDSQEVTNALRNVGGLTLPSTLDGYPQAGSTGIRGLAAYGTGFSKFVAIALPSSFAFDWYRAATDAGASLTRYGGADTATMSTPLLSVVIMLGPFGFGIALAGPVTPDVLTSAARDLTSIFGPGNDRNGNTGSGP